MTGHLDPVKLADRAEIAETHIAADHDALRRCWRLAQAWRDMAARGDRAQVEARWLRGAATLLEQAITGIPNA